ncbi:MAG: hypothetical protein CUN56_08040 [Phototrophicales bacterium]|nr:MAG: hypothetical protein CUN56_08040 [Phototrophicales bacterium]RMG71199.1 MAG: hypothetical protein D6711_15905 [Chloroflexota bacterium]
MYKQIPLILICVLILAACEAEPTPFPVDLPPTPEPTLAPTAIPAVRYGLDVNTAGWMPNASSMIVMTEAVDPADLGGRFDLIAAYGLLDGWQQAPQPANVTLIVDPLAISSDLIMVIFQAVDPGAVVTNLAIPGSMVLENLHVPPDMLLNTLANLGKPDGLGMAMGVTFVPGAEIIQAQLAAVNIHTRLVNLSHSEIAQAFAEKQIQLALVTWSDSPPDFSSAENMLNLYALPISYLAVDDLEITFTEQGFPVAHWRDS